MGEKARGASHVEMGEKGGSLIQGMNEITFIVFERF